MAKERWKSMDMIKGLGCMAVCLIHVLFPEPLKYVVKSIARFAVPVFFFSSVFFYLNKGTISIERQAKKIDHVIHLIIKVCSFYALFCLIYNAMKYGFDWGKQDNLKSKIEAGRIVKLFITNDPLIYSHLWFLLALLYIYLFALFVFREGKRLNHALLIGSILLICYSVLQEFAADLHLPRSLPIPGSEARIYFFNLFLFRAMPFFLFGVEAQSSLDKIQRIKIKPWIFYVLIVFGSIMSVFENKKYGEVQFYVGNLITFFCLVLLSIIWPNKGSSILCYIGKNLSSNVYFYHIAVQQVFDLLCLKLKLNTGIITWFRPIIILTFSLLLALLIEKSKKRLSSIARHQLTKEDSV